MMQAGDILGEATKNLIEDQRRELVELHNALTQARGLMTDMLGHAGKKETCKGEGCGRDIWFVMHTNGKRTPYDADGVNHFITCPDAKRFHRRSKTT